MLRGNKKGFFTAFCEKDFNYKLIKREEKRRIKIEQIEKERNEKIELQKAKQEEALEELRSIPNLTLTPKVEELEFKGKKRTFMGTKVKFK